MMEKAAEVTTARKPDRRGKNELILSVKLIIIESQFNWVTIEFYSCCKLTPNFVNFIKYLQILNEYSKIFLTSLYLVL